MSNERVFFPTILPLIFLATDKESLWVKLRFKLKWKEFLKVLVAFTAATRYDIKTELISQFFIRFGAKNCIGICVYSPVSESSHIQKCSQNSLTTINELKINHSVNSFLSRDIWCVGREWLCPFLAIRFMGVRHNSCFTSVHSPDHRINKYSVSRLYQRRLTI